MSIEVTVAIISSITTAILGPIAVYLFKEVFGKKKKDVLKESIKINTLVSNKVEEIKEEFKADRVWVEQFHNGGIFYPTGKSIQKFSMVYETVNSGVYSIQQSFQNIPISLFSKSINHLVDEGVIKIYDFKNDIFPTYGLKYIAEENDVKSGYIFAIKSINGKFIGILGLDYVKRKVQLSDEEINQLIVEATTIGGVLNKK